MSILSVEGLQKSFYPNLLEKWAGKHEVQALKDISFEIQKGESVALLGRNGAGKTTTLKCLFELIHPDQGRVRYFDGLKINSEVKKRIGFLPERPYFYDGLTGFEILLFFAKLSGLEINNTQKSEAMHLLKSVGLEDAAHRPLRSYSKGMLQRIGFAQALVHKPEFIVLDEPLSGLDPDGRFEIKKMIQGALEQEVSLLLSSHLLADIEHLCERLVILDKGRLVYEGSVKSFIEETQAKVTIRFYRRSDELEEREVTSENVNIEIENLQRQGLEIYEVQRQRLSLEEAFVSKVRS